MGTTLSEKIQQEARTAIIWIKAMCSYVAISSSTCEYGKFPSKFVNYGCTPCPPKYDDCSKQGKDEQACLKWCRSFFENVSLPNTRLPTTRTTIATSEIENTVYNGKNGGKRNKSGLSVAKVVVLVVVLPLVSIIVLAVIAYLKIRNRRNLRMTEAEANAEPSGSDLPLTGHDDEMVSESIEENQKGSVKSVIDKSAQLQVNGNCVQETLST
ncbi:uncharacterized protein LOC124437673 [Xenia sp. Carnegie-2017]|uniref:uncharacterized protein LOC124437673 n=1 Tax=Xenia sp. Carnegie-2017 TaxID=2897299 RepID=UPI001F044009|nr:uncharacterized protein LOC124437673 [Xenia sp. Carnegie-2017]